MNPQELKSIMGSGLLSFPLTDFDAQGDFDKKGYIERLEWLAPYGASALFAAGGTGEFFSLTGDEYPGIIQTAVDTCRGKVPIIAGAGGPTRFAIQCAQAAEKAGAHGILLLPHYLTEAGQEGLAAHVEAVCKSVKFGVIVYNRGLRKLYARHAGKAGRALPEPDRLQGRHRRHRTDGLDPPAHGRPLRLPRRPADGGGLRRGLQGAGHAGVFVGGVQLHPEDRDGLLRRGRATTTSPTQHRLLKDFFMPYLDIRNRGPGLRGEHRQGRRQDRRPRRRPGAHAADRPEVRRDAKRSTR